MFLQKIDRLATDWDRQSNELEGVARESLLYGMRITRHPSALKKELKKVKISSLLAKPLWSGNAYLLHTLPQVLTNKKKKIPCLADFLFARKTLSRENLRELRTRQKNLCAISREELLKGILPNIKKQAWRGRFIPQFDSMHESLKDIEQDLIVQALEIVNKEISNFKSTNKEEIVSYLGYCLDKKGDTYLLQHTPKQVKARIEPEDFDRVVHQARKEESGEVNDYAEVEFKKDLETVLPKRMYRGIALLMQFADPLDTRKFDRYLRGKQIRPEWLTQTQLKHHIEKFLGTPIFDKVMETPELRDFLLKRINANHVDQVEAEDGADSGYAKCSGL